MLVTCLTKPWIEIVYPNGKTISQVKRYVHTTSTLT